VRLDKVEIKDIKDAYRSTFSTKDGRLVLQHMLYELRMLQRCEDEKDRHLHNYGRRILALLDVDESNMYEVFVNKALDLPIREGRRES